MNTEKDLWSGSFAREVEGLEYEYPFDVGDVVYYPFEDEEKDKRSKRYPMKVIEVGVPVATDFEYEKKRTPHGRMGHFRKENGDYVEGVRVQHIWFEGDKGHGFKENFPVESLEKLENHKTQLDRYNEWKDEQVHGSTKPVEK